MALPILRLSLLAGVLMLAASSSASAAPIVCLAAPGSTDCSTPFNGVVNAGDEFDIELFAEGLSGYEGFSIDALLWDPVARLEFVSGTEGPHTDPLTFFEGYVDASDPFDPLSPPGLLATSGFFDVSAAPSDSFALATLRFKALSAGLVTLTLADVLQLGLGAVYFQPVGSDPVTGLPFDLEAAAEVFGATVDIQASVVPEPATIGLVSIGLLGSALRARVVRRRASQRRP